MPKNKIDFFNETAPVLFKPLVDQYGYTLVEIKVNEEKLTAHHIYVNHAKQLRIIIKQEPYYTDYGFSFFIYKMGTNEFTILYNIAHENQDDEGNFLVKASKDLFSTTETLDVITGESWKVFSQIPFRF